MALFQTLQDNFNDNSFNTSLWTRSSSAQVLETNQEWEFTTTLSTTYYAADSAINYDLTGSYVFVQLVNAGNQALASLEITMPTLVKDASNTMFWYLNTGTLRTYKKVAGVQTQIGTGLAYNSATHKYFRIRESGGTTFFDWSTDGISWTNYTSVANPFAVTALQVEISVGTYAIEASTTTVKFDNFNITPSTASNSGFFNLMR